MACINVILCVVRVGREGPFSSRIAKAILLFHLFWNNNPIPIWHQGTLRSLALTPHENWISRYSRGERRTLPVSVASTSRVLDCWWPFLCDPFWPFLSNPRRAFFSRPEQCIYSLLQMRSLLQKSKNTAKRFDIEVALDSLIAVEIISYYANGCFIETELYEDNVDNQFRGSGDSIEVIDGRIT